MRSGISYPSVARSVTWLPQTATDASYPVANMARLDEPRRITRAAAAGAFEIFGQFAEDSVVDFVAIVHHNLPAGATVRLVVYDDIANYDYGYDTGVVPVWPSGTYDAGFPNVRPFLLPAPIVGQGLYMRFDNVGDTTVQLGGVEVGQFWNWNVEVPRGIGVESRSTSTESAGVQHVTRQWAPRTVTGERELVAKEEVDTKFMDFQMDAGMDRSFVWCWDVDNPLTWARECMLVVNSALPGGSSPSCDVGRMGFAFREHLR